MKSEAQPSNLSVLILTLDEEVHIERCLNSALQVTRNIFVVDSFSTDNTRALAASMGATVVQHQFINHALQLQWALEQMPFDTEWVMRMDADEVISSELAENIRTHLSQPEESVAGFVVPLYVKFGGTLITHGGYPQQQLRIWRKSQARIEQKWMDERVLLTRGRTVLLQGAYIDHNLKNLTWWTEKHNAYATREAIDLLNQKYNVIPTKQNSPEVVYHTSSKRWLKENIYVRFPLGVRALLFFLYRMVFLLGVLDGPKGFVFHFLQGFWYRFLADMKMWEVEQRMKRDGIDCAEAIRRQLGVNPV